MPESDKRFWLERMNKFFNDESNWEDAFFKYLQTEEGRTAYENLPDRSVIKGLSFSEATFLLAGQTKEEMFSDFQELHKL